MNDSPEHSSRIPIIDRLFRYAYKLPISDRFFFAIAFFAVCASMLWTLAVINERVSVDTPSREGTITEGIVGTPRFVNPVLAATQADRDLAALLYAGLARVSAEGAIVPDVADSITVSDDGLVYNVVLRTDVFFHDGTPLTAADVAFTIRYIQEPQIGSPLRASWEGVAVEVIGEYELNFVLTSAYAPFIENLTVGILPQHIWKDASIEEFPFSQYNSEPIGAGPYKIRSVVRNASGIPQSYTLVPHTAYHRGEPQIQGVTLNFYTNESKLVEAFNARAINSVAGLSPETISALNRDEDEYVIQTTPLPRTFAVFFNQNKSAALRDSAAREALSVAVNRDDLIAQVLGGFGAPLYSPIPPGFLATSTESLDGNIGNRLDAARTIMREGGWEMNTETGVWEKTIDGTLTPLAFSISTANAKIFERTASYLESTWSSLGANVSVKQFEQSDLTQAVIRPRDYEALLFGTVLGRALDFYSFWHSSQRNDPGLNVALYANISTDSELQIARTSTDADERAEAIVQFVTEMETETPAVFLYSPLFTYVLPNEVAGAKFTGLAEPQERFSNISEWYVKTQSVWPFFTD